MKIYHGSCIWKAESLFAPREGLYVTDTYKRALLYANAQSGSVVGDANFTSGAVIFELETNEDVVWLRRKESHNTLDKCEALINNWHVIKITLYTTRYDLDHGKSTKLFVEQHNPHIVVIDCA